MTSVPIAVLSTSTVKAHASIFGDVKEQVDEFNSKVENVVNFFNGVVNWFKNLKSNISSV